MKSSPLQLCSSCCTSTCNNKNHHRKTRHTIIVVIVSCVMMTKFAKQTLFLYNNPSSLTQTTTSSSATSSSSVVAVNFKSSSPDKERVGDNVSTDRVNEDVAAATAGTTTTSMSTSINTEEGDGRTKIFSHTNNVKAVVSSSSGTTTSTSSSSSSIPVPISIVIQLSGEMANNLQHIAHGYGLKLWLNELSNGIVTANIILRHDVGPNTRAPKPKWKKAKTAIEKCFLPPSTYIVNGIHSSPSDTNTNNTNWDFTKGNTRQFKQIQKLQQQWLSNKEDTIFGLINSQHSQDIQNGLQLFLNEIILNENVMKTKPTIESSDIASGNDIHIPYLFSQSLDIFPMIDKYYDEFRQLFVLNETACCPSSPTSSSSRLGLVDGLLPYHDEYVFHFRNYQSELPGKRAYDMGFAELSPYKVANELFPNLVKFQTQTQTTTGYHHHHDNRLLSTSSLGKGKHKEKESNKKRRPRPRVAITTRIPNSIAKEYVNELEKRGYKTRLITDHRSNNNEEDNGDVNDFCFLTKTNNGLVGHARSTFVLWAGILGNASTVRLYNVDTYGIRTRHTNNFLERFSYNWTNELLQQKIIFELYKSEEVMN